MSHAVKRPLDVCIRHVADGCSSVDSFRGDPRELDCGTSMRHVHLTVQVNEVDLQELTCARSRDFIVMPGSDSGATPSVSEMKVNAYCGKSFLSRLMNLLISELRRG